MARSTLALLALLGLALSAPAASANPARAAFATPPPSGLRHQVNVIGEDSRRPLQAAEQQSLRGVVQLLVEDGASTAWFVGDCQTMVATYHGIYDNEGMPYSDRAAFVIGGEVLPFHLSEVEITAGLSGPYRTVRRMHLDYVILQLPSALPDCGAIDYRTVSGDEVAALNGAIAMVGFHGDAELHQPLLQSECPAYRDRTTLFLAGFHGFETDHVLFHGCDTVGGSSGSPIFITQDGVPTAVGLNSASVSLDSANLKRRHRKTKQIPERVAHQNPNLAIWFHPCAAIVRDLDRILGRPAGDCADATN